MLGFANQKTRPTPLDRSTRVGLCRCFICGVSPRHARVFNGQSGAIWPKRGLKWLSDGCFFFFAFVCTFFGFGGLKMGDFFLVPLQAFYCISMSRRWKLKQMRPNTKFQKLRLSPQWLLMTLFSMVAVSFSNSQNPTFQFFSFYHKKSAF